MIPYMVIGSFDWYTILHIVNFDEQIFAELNRNKFVKFIELDFKKTFDFYVWIIEYKSGDHVQNLDKFSPIIIVDRFPRW